MTNYKTEQLAQEEKFEKTMLVTLGGSWLECSDYERTVDEMKSYLLSRDQALKEALKRDNEDKINELKGALIWCSGSDDFQLEGKAREGWEKICVPLLKDYKLNPQEEK